MNWIETKDMVLQISTVHLLNYVFSSNLYCMVTDFFFLNAEWSLLHPGKQWDGGWWQCRVRCWPFSARGSGRSPTTSMYICFAWYFQYELFHFYTLSGKPIAADFEWIVCESLVTQGTPLSSREGSCAAESHILSMIVQYVTNMWAECNRNLASAMSYMKLWHANCHVWWTSYKK